MPEETNQPSDFGEAKQDRLRGQTVLVTRAVEQSESFRDHLERLGAAVIVHPAIEIQPLADFIKLDAALEKLSRSGAYRSVVFVSSNGVTHFFDRLDQKKISIDVIENRNVIAIGAATLARLGTIGIGAVCSPTVSNSESLAELIIKQASDQPVLIIRANRGSDELVNRLKGSGIGFEEVITYQSIDVTSADPEVLELILQGNVDWVTMTSSAIARSSIRLFGDAIARSSGKVKTVSISPKTSQAMRDLGLEPDAEAEDFNMLGIIAAMQDAD